MPIKVAFSHKTAYTLLGGCTYFVSHPGGRSFDTYPVTVKSTPGIFRFVAEHNKDLRMDTPVELVNQEYPHTLD